MRRGRRDRGAATLEYTAVIAMVAAIIATVATADVGPKIGDAFSSAVCSITQQGGCEPTNGNEGDQADPGDPADPGDQGDPSGDNPTGGDDPGGAETAEEREAREAVEALDAIEQEAGNAENEWANADKEILQFLSELIGLDAAIKCVKEGDIMACLETAATMAPWGKALKILSKIPKAVKLFKKLKGLWDRVRDLRRRRKAARDRYNKVCPISGNSFTGGALVLLADGGRRPIEDIRIGDRVVATDVVTGATSARAVTAVLTDTGRKHLVDITIDLDGRTGGPKERITATRGHPFWVEDTGWVDAGDLRASDRLVGPGGADPMVFKTRSYDRVQRVHNLSVAGVHTYHVGAGSVDILVHNTTVPRRRPKACGPEPPGLDGTGKVHTPPGESLPRYPPKNWTREQMQDVAEALRKSIDKRKRDMKRYGDGDPGHMNRIREEEQLLRAIEKKLSGS